jgi:hypothetical protein
MRAYLRTTDKTRPTQRLARSRSRASAAHFEQNPASHSVRDANPLLQLQRQYGNRYVGQVMASAKTGNGRKSVASRAKQGIQQPYRDEKTTRHWGFTPPVLRCRGNQIQRDNDETPGAEETPGETQLPALDFRLTPSSTLWEPRFKRMLRLVPPLVNPLERGDVSRFRTRIDPLSPDARDLLETTPPWLQPPPTQEGGAESSPAVPGSATLYSAGPARFRLVFEEPSLQLPESVREAEARYERNLGTAPSSQLDTGAMITGLIKNFLTQTPPGRQILQGLRRVIGGAEREETSGLSVNLNLDVLPAPILEGEPPRFMLNLEGRW